MGAGRRLIPQPRAVEKPDCALFGFRLVLTRDLEWRKHQIVKSGHAGEQIELLKHHAPFGPKILHVERRAVDVIPGENETSIWPLFIDFMPALKISAIQAPLLRESARIPDAICPRLRPTFGRPLMHSIGGYVASVPTTGVFSLPSLPPIQIEATSAMRRIAINPTNFPMSATSRDKKQEMFLFLVGVS